MLSLLNELWGIRLRGLSPQVEELQQHCVMGNFWGLMAVLFCPDVVASWSGVLGGELVEGDDGVDSEQSC